MGWLIGQLSEEVTIGATLAIVASGVAWFGKFIMLPIRDRAILSFETLDRRHEENLKDQVTRTERMATERAYLLSALETTCSSVEKINERLERIEAQLEK